MNMLDGVSELTLDFLNQATQAWMEVEYNRAVIAKPPARRSSGSPRRPTCCAIALRAKSLRDAFRLETKRIQRQSDGTISLEGVRFEIPGRYRHFREVTVRYARWDLGRVDLVDERSGVTLAPIYPLDKTANADGRRAVIEPGGSARLSSPKSDVPPEAGRRTAGELPPLLKSILQEYSATGMPPAYLPKTPRSQNGEPS